MRTVRPLRESSREIMRRRREAHVGQRIVSPPLSNRLPGSVRSMLVNPPADCPRPPRWLGYHPPPDLARYPVLIFQSNWLLAKIAPLNQGWPPAAPPWPNRNDCSTWGSR